MRTGTVVSLGASAVLGLGALLVAKVWLPQPNKGPQSPAGAVPVDTVPVVVASTDIPYGTKLDAGKLAVERLPASAAPRGAFSQPSQILAERGGPPIALIPITAREVVLPGQLSGGGARPTVAAVIDEGMRAYTIGVSDIAGVGGHVLPGDRVDVVLTEEAPKFEPKPGERVCQNCKPHISLVVLQDVKVLGIDLNADPSSTQAAVAHTATLEVTVQDAQKLAVAAQTGSLSLALRRTGNAEVAPARLVGDADLYRSQRDQVWAEGGRLTTAARRKAGAATSPLLVRTRSVIVVHGDTSSSVEVPAERFGAGA